MVGIVTLLKQWDTLAFVISTYTGDRQEERAVCKVLLSVSFRLQIILIFHGRLGNSISALRQIQNDEEDAVVLFKSSVAGLYWHLCSVIFYAGKINLLS
jgi:hypothetical protein